MEFRELLGLFQLNPNSALTIKPEITALQHGFLSHQGTQVKT